LLELKGVPRICERNHAMKEIAGNEIHLQAREIADLVMLAIRIAIPFVKPTTTGRGKYFTMLPMPVTPSSTRSRRHHRAREQSVDPVLRDDPATTTTKAPVGPPICVLGSPSSEIRNPVTIAQYQPCLPARGLTQSKRHRQRQRDETHGHSGDQIGNELIPIVPRSRSIDFGSQASMAGVMAASEEKSLSGF